MRKALALAGGALAAAGLADIALYGAEVGPTQVKIPQTATSGITSQTGGGSIPPDYVDFLNWLKGAVGKVAGKSLSVSLETEFAPYALRGRDIDFFSSAHVATNYDLTPYTLQLSNITLMASTKSPTFDVFSVDNQNLASFTSAIIPPSELAQMYPDLTYPKFDPPDFRPFVWDEVANYPPILGASTSSSSSSSSSSSTTTSVSASETPGGVVMYPFDAPLQVLHYRKDIFSKLGMALPKTWDEYFEDAKSLMNQGTPYATVSQANADVSIIYEYLNHLTSFGGTLWEIENGTTLIPVMDSDAAVAALENFVRFAPYADPASHTYSWTDVFTSLSRGTAATGILWHDYYSWLNDPARSVVAGKMSLTTNPAGPEGAFSTFGGAGLGVSRYSRNQDAAWLWLQWATAKGTQEEMLLDIYHIFPTRTSVFDAPPVKSLPNDATTQALAVANAAWNAGATALTPFPLWLRALIPLAVHLNNAWTGVETPQVALTNAKQGIEQLAASTPTGTLTF